MLYTRFLIKSKEINICINGKKCTYIYLAYFQISLFFPNHCELCEIKTKLVANEFVFLCFDLIQNGRFTDL